MAPVKFLCLYVLLKSNLHPSRESQRNINSYYVANPEAAWKSVHCNLAWFQMIFIGWDEMRNSIYVIGKDIPVSWIPLIPRMSGPDIRGISVYVKSTYTENSWALPWSGQQVVTRVETLIFSKYLVGSRANPWHGHVVVKSLGFDLRFCGFS